MSFIFDVLKMVGIKFSFLYSSLFIKLYNYFYNQLRKWLFQPKILIKNFSLYSPHDSYQNKKVAKWWFALSSCNKAMNKTKWFSAHEQYNTWYLKKGVVICLFLFFKKKCFYIHNNHTSKTGLQNPQSCCKFCRSKLNVAFHWR